MQVIKVNKRTTKFICNPKAEKKKSVLSTNKKDEKTEVKDNEIIRS